MTDLSPLERDAMARRVMVEVRRGVALSLARRRGRARRRAARLRSLRIVGLGSVGLLVAFLTWLARR